MTFRSPPVCLVVAMVVASRLGLADPMPAQATSGRDTGAISGLVLDGATKQPLGGAIVSLLVSGRGAAGQLRREITDGKGRFVFTNLTGPDTYTVNAAMFGYFDGAFGLVEGAPVAGSILLAGGEWFRQANIPLWRPAAISGTVSDARSEPIAGMYVRALMEARVAGVSQFISGLTAITDDRGVYRLAGLTPGRYLVEVLSPQATVPADATAPSHLVLDRLPVSPATPEGRLTAYPVLFHPGARTMADAVAIAIDHGEARSAIDFRLDAVATVRVSGRVTGPADAIAGVPLRLYTTGAESLGHGSETATAVTAADGSFTFVSVPAGDYVVQANRSQPAFTAIPQMTRSIDTPSLPGAPFEFQMLTVVATGVYLNTRNWTGSQIWTGEARVSAGATDVSGVSIALRHAATVSGRIACETATATDPPAPFAVTAEPANGSSALGMPRARFEAAEGGGLFTLAGLRAGEYLLRGAPPTGWTLKSVVWNGRDYTDTPLDASSGQDINDVVMTFTNATTLVTGVARTGDGLAAASAAVLVFPAARELWSRYGMLPPRIRATHASSAGTFRVTGLPDGQYLLVAVDESRISSWQDPAFLADVAPQATRLSLHWGDAAQQDLKMVTVR